MRSPKAETPAPAAAGGGRQESEHVSRRLLDSDNALINTEQEQKHIGEAVKTVIADSRVHRFFPLYLARLTAGVAIAVMWGAPR